MHPLARRSLLVVLSICLVGCSDEEPKISEDASAKDAPHEDATTDAAPPPDAAPQPDQIVDSAAPAPDTAAPPLALSVVFRQKVLACSSCGIWFHWQGVQSQKPRLEILYTVGGVQKLRQVQHGLNGENNAHSISISPTSTEADRDKRRHTMLIKKTPARTGLFRADLSDIPAVAKIVSAKLHLHLHAQEGLAYSDHSSVITIHECPGGWSWDTVTWTHRAPGVAWTTPGGDASRLVLQIHADTDMHKRGFNKASPNGFFDITAHLQLLQSER